ncbi:MAG TPA: PKD domain-containing protein [Gemmatimonadales bacterium]|nr:PKD domain-containing protein [Gemmatimonadales bacterium]
MLRPIDLVYICGNRFLVTNETRSTVQVTYRLAGTDENFALTLLPGFEEEPGYSETELETRERGTVELYQNDQLLVRRANEGSACGAPALSASVGGAAVAGPGSWTAPFAWPIVPLQVSLLPNGKVLAWGHTGQPQVWDPETGSFTEVTEPVELFCAGQTLLADGRVLAAGGHITNGHGLPAISIFDWRSNSWSSANLMQRGRWYPTATTLGTGEVVITAGRDQNGSVVTIPEIWSGGTIRPLTNASLTLPYYPRMLLAPNGKLFYVGEPQTSRYLNPTGSGSWSIVGNRLYGQRDYGAAVMYEPGKILYVGGGRTTNTAEIIDLNQDAPAWQWTGSMVFRRRHLNATLLPTGEVLVTGGVAGTAFNDLTQAVHAAEIWSPASGAWTTLASNVVNRGYHAVSLLLPDGRVLHAGSGNGAGAPSERNGEIFSPPYLSQGPRPTITDAPTAVPYGGSITVVTPDAGDIDKVSLIRMGSTTHAFDANQRFEWLSFTRSGGALTIQAPDNRNRTPPGYYLLFILNGAKVPSKGRIIQVGSTSEPVPLPAGPMSLQVTGRSDATKQYMTLIWAGAKGATVDMYRNGSFRKNTPNDGKQGDSRLYTGAATYIYKVCEANTYTCSNPASISFKNGLMPANKAPIAAFTLNCSQLDCNFVDGSVDLDGTLKTWMWNFGDGSTSSLQSPPHSYTAAGSYPITLTVTDNRNGVKSVSKQVTVAGPPPPNLPPTAAFAPACSNLDCSFTDGSTDPDGRITAWRWEFGDGGISTLAQPSHTYTAAGTYDVVLTVTDDDQATDQGRHSVAVTAAPVNTPPRAAFSFTCTDLDCSFTDGSTDNGAVVGWSWDFGDGGSSSQQSPSHHYDLEGSYQATLTVTDDQGITAAQTETVTVPTQTQAAANTP